MNALSIAVVALGIILIYVSRKWRPQNEREDRARRHLLMAGIVVLALILVWFYIHLPLWVILICLGFTVLVAARVLVGMRG